MILGDFQFSLKTMSPSAITRSTEYNWSDAERVGDLPNLQNLGITKDQIEIEGVFYPKFKGSSVWEQFITDSTTKRILNFLEPTSKTVYSSVDEIRSSNLCKIASNLINDSGEILGKFVIASIKETQSFFDKNGQAQKIEFTLVLKRSPTTESNSLLSNLENSTSVVDTLTNLARSYLRW